MTANPTPAEVVDVPHDKAMEALSRLINSHFRREPIARVSIPARPDYDDDLVLCAYIEQRKAADQRAAELAAQNAALLWAVEEAKWTFARIGQSHTVDAADEEILRRCWREAQDACEQMRAALATTPAEALAVVREMQAALATEIMMHGMHGNKCTSDAADAARRLYGSAR